MEASEHVERRQPAEEFSRWLVAARTGSPQALGELLEPLRRYLLLVAEAEIDDELRVKEAASDVVQQTFLQAHRAINDFAGSSQEEWRGWLRQILVNEIRQAGRHYQTAKRRMGREVALADDSSASGDWQLAGPDSTPSQKASAQEELARLEDALSRLPEEYREVIERRNARESFEEIGRTMGRSAAAAQKLWSRAVERLGRELA